MLRDLWLVGKIPRTHLVGIGVLAFLAAMNPQVQVQGQSGLSSGGPTGLGTGLAGPRGSAINSSGGSSSSSGDPEKLGGLSGGEGRNGGSAGSSARSGNRSSPGDPGESLLGPPLGASGTALEDNVPGNRGPRTLGGRLGRTANPSTRPGATARQGQDQATVKRLERTRQAIQPPEADPISFARRPGLELPSLEEDVGPDDGLTLDVAIEVLLRQNLDLMAQRFEIPKAEADLLTAGLRDNPILYADAQLVPYGNFTRDRPGGGGGQPQYDVNVSIPLDLSQKRRGRIAVAQLAKKVTEAQLQDAARNLIDNLYSSYVNVLAARDSLRFGELYLSRIDRDLADADAEDREETRKPQASAEDRQATADAVVELRSRRQQSRLQVRQAGRQLTRATSNLAQILNIPADQSVGLRVRARLREVVPTPLPVDELVHRALSCRPDLVAYRLGTSRADADVRLARANRYSDVFLVYQPFTVQAGHSFGNKDTYLYGFGVNAALPLFNRNQGNIARALSNASQTRVELAALEQRAAYEVRQTVSDIELGQADLIEMERVVIPAAIQARDVAHEQYRADSSKVGDYIDELGDLNDVIRQYRDALIDFRQDMLDLNTSVGQRVLP